MSSIWDAPGSPRNEVPSSGFRSVEMIDPRKRLYGTDAGPLITSEGRGVVNGIPMGEVAQERERALDTQYRYRPDWRRRLAAATDAALSR